MKSKEQEKLREHKELRDYFIIMCDNLIESIKEQIEDYVSLIEQIDENPYGGYQRTVVSEMNLDKIFYITPVKAHEIFTSEQTDKIKVKQESLSKIYNAFDNIQGVKDLDGESDQVFRKEHKEISDGFWDIAFKLKQFKRKISYEITTSENKPLYDLMKQFREIVNEFDKLVSPTIGQAYNELFLKTVTLFNSKNEYVESEYWIEFGLILDQAVRHKTLCEDLTKKYLKIYTESYKASLETYKKIIEDELKVLNS